VFRIKINDEGVLFMKVKITRFLLLIITVCLMLSINVPYAAAATYRYQGKAEFYFSNDGGARFGRESRIFYTDDIILMQVRFSVAIVNRSMFSPRTSEVGAVLTIPITDDVDVVYMEGQIIEPVIDRTNNVFRYEYTLTATSDPVEQRIVFQFKANSATTMRMTFEFDKDADIDPLSNTQHIIEFIEPENIVPEEPDIEDDIISDDLIHDDVIIENQDIIRNNNDNNSSNTIDNSILLIVLIGVGVAICVSITTLIIVLVKIIPKKQ